MATVAVQVKRRGDGVGYQLGVDIGTTHTAAAILRRGRAEMAMLGHDSEAIPSVVFLDTDDVVVVGNAANEQGFSDPSRVARAFKRRLGDPTPIALGGGSYSADDLMAKLLRRVVDLVSEREGAGPDLVTVTHPANWGAYRTDLLGQAIRAAGLETFRLLSDPEAAAVFHAATEGADEGDVMAVYDLGGGTFDVWVARKTADGFEVLGVPEGIDRLGGIDFDEAVLAHISDAVGVGPDDFDTDDPSTVAAVAHLRQECAVVKETLSTDPEVSVPVFLPGGEREVRVTRDDLDAMVRPALVETIQVLRRTLHAAEVQPGDLAAVVLTGGSSRIPLVARLVSEELGRPVTVATQPTHAAALGAALSMVAWAEEHAPTTPADDDAAEADEADEPDGVDEADKADEAGKADEPGKADKGNEADKSNEAAIVPEAPGIADGAKTASADQVTVSVKATALGAPTATTLPADDAPGGHPSAGSPGPPAMSALMSVAAVAVALVIVAAAVGAGTLIAVGQVAAGVALIAVGVTAGVGLFVMVSRPSGSTAEELAPPKASAAPKAPAAPKASAAPGTTGRREGSSL